MKERQVTLVLATKNPGKTREFLRLLAELAPDVRWTVMRADEANLKEVNETGSTFAENARQKAREAATQSGMLCLGEDSGLEVDFLGGAPGVRSHRFSSTGRDDDNNALLLEMLKDAPLDRRTARYRCAIAVYGPGGMVVEAEGSVEGIIIDRYRGKNGFGYDPLFFANEIGKTLGEASDAEKDAVSHRRRALEKVLPTLLGEGPS